MSAAITFTLPIRTVSNAREHWRAHANRVALERSVTWKAFLGARGRPLQPGEMARVHLTRVSRGTLDAHENLPHALKGIVDQIAAQLGLPKQDNSPRLSWSYSQSKGEYREHAVIVDIDYVEAL